MSDLAESDSVQDCGEAGLRKGVRVGGQNVLLVERASLVDLDSAIGRLRKAGSCSFMLLACEDDHWDPTILATWLSSIDVPVFGGIFPSIIHGAKCLRHGTLVVGFPVPAKVAVIKRLSDRAGVEEQLRASTAQLEGAQSLIVLFDGLCPNLEAFVEGLYAIVGFRSTVVGGGAGHLDLMQHPCLLTNTGVFEDSALLVALPTVIDRGMAHGWQLLSGPFLVTRSEGNVLAELNYQPAYDVYCKAVEAQSDWRFSDTDFFSISKIFPLGIECVDGEFLVRDPIKQAHEALTCVGEVPQNATVYLLKGEADALIAAAGEAARAACAERQRRTNSADASVAMVFDCISRVLFLGVAFNEELAAIEAALTGCDEIFGALTLGEISSSKAGVIELMNKSTVVALIETAPQS